MDENCLYWETITSDNRVLSMNYQLTDVIPYCFLSGHLLPKAIFLVWNEYYQ